MATDTTIFKIKQHSTRPVYIVALEDNFGTSEAAPVDLSVYNKVTMVMRKREEKGAPQVTAEVAIKDAPNGIVEYAWAEADTSNDVGLYDVEFIGTLKAGGTENIPNDGYFQVEITEDLTD